MFVVLAMFASAVWVLFDARSIGVRKGLVPGIGNMGPTSWFVVVFMLWIVSFPAYLYYRAKFIAAVADGAPPADGAAIDELERLSALKDKGALTQDEFDKQKANLLTRSKPQKKASGAVVWVGWIFFGAVVVGLFIDAGGIGGVGAEMPECDSSAARDTLMEAVNQSQSGRLGGLSAIEIVGAPAQIGDYQSGKTRYCKGAVRLNTTAVLNVTFRLEPRENGQFMLTYEEQ
jgi:hypothetical protein